MYFWKLFQFNFHKSGCSFKRLKCRIYCSGLDWQFPKVLYDLSYLPFRLWITDSLKSRFKLKALKAWTENPGGFRGKLCAHYGSQWIKHVMETQNVIRDGHIGTWSKMGGSSVSKCLHNTDGKPTPTVPFSHNFTFPNIIPVSF